jgi:hypothetical protein
VQASQEPPALFPSYAIQTNRGQQYWLYREKVILYLSAPESLWDSKNSSIILGLQAWSCDAAICKVDRRHSEGGFDG